MNESYESNPGSSERECILKTLGIIPDTNEDSGGSYVLDEPFDSLPERESIERKTLSPIAKPEELFEYFDGIRVAEPDKIIRPAGDTTIFTTAGVQHIETIQRNQGELNRDSFMIAQPVIRSQYMDKVKDGSSSAFVNFSIESVDTNLGEFSELCQKMISMVRARGADASDLRFTIETLGDKWGEKQFMKTVLTVIAKDVEIGEGVYMHDYPKDNGERIAIADICFGTERLNWALGDRKCFFQDFEGFYAEDTDSNATTAAIDCMRTAVLMVGEGVKPAHTDPGFRLRRLSKKFAERNRGLQLDAGMLIDCSWNYWIRWGFKPDLSKEETRAIIESENTRSFNNMVLLMIEQRGGPKITININQHTEAFLRQMDISLPPQTKEIYKQVRGEIERANS